MRIKKFIKDSVTDIQKKVCDKIGQYVNRYSVRQRKIGLAVFGLVAGTICFMLIIGTVGSEDSGHAIQVDSITRAKSIHTFRLDSLKSIPEKVVDSLKSMIRDFYNGRMDH